MCATCLRHPAHLPLQQQAGFASSPLAGVVLAAQADTLQPVVLEEKEGGLHRLALMFPHQVEALAAAAGGIPTTLEAGAEAAQVR